MNVSWLTPYKHDPELACGAVVEAEIPGASHHEFIPFPLEPEHINDIMKRGPIWLVEQLPYDFPVFMSMQQAEEALYHMYMLHQAWEMSIEAMYDLVERFNGHWHSKAEYGYELRPFDNDFA